MKKLVPIQAIDFFCGAGGLTKGLLDAGVDVRLGIDFDEKAEKTYTNNNGVPFLGKDLRELTFQDLEPYIKKFSSPLLFAGCAPCQPFSQINRTQGDRKNEDLLLRFGEFIEHFKPEFVISENVPQLTKKRDVFDKFIKLLEKNGYAYDYGFIDAKDVGVPQMRKRLVLIASIVSEIKIPTTPKTLRTVKDAIAHFPKLSQGEESQGYNHHSARSLSELNLIRIQHTPPNGGDSRSWPDKLKLPCHKKVKGFTDVYGRMFWDKPAPTLTTKCNSYSNGRFGHPEQDRAITLREAAALQSFPDDYIFYGNQGLVAKHIGNAVPPLLGKFLGEYILTLHRAKKLVRA
jgi:DNA (cytosine-5)-methyltransferase 1